MTYGTSFQKEYTIDVSPANTEFEFLLDGELQLTSTPSNSKVFLDGMEQGRTPMTLNFLGEHNLRLENDHVTYFDYNERIGLKPFEQTTLNVPMRKRPPRTYGMVLANYAPDVTGAGLTLAFVKRWGLYVRFLQNFESQKDFEKPETTVSQAGYYKGTKVAMKIFTAGLMVRCNKHIYVYGGAGTGNYCKTLTFEAGRGDDEISPYGAKGLAADAGIILKWKALLLQGGYNMILGENNPSPYKGLYVGLGITIHKQRKDK